MKTIVWIALGVLFGLLASAFILLIAQQPHGEAIRLLPPPTTAPLVVQVSGAVASPGVYNLAPGSRAQQAIAAAGGLTGDADPAQVNLAAEVRDGEQIIIPAWQPTPLPPRPTATSRLAEPTPTVFVPSIDHPVNINTATQAELEALPGIGPVRAQQILMYRDEKGPFKRIEDILNVPGIEQETYDMIKRLITV